jgi:RNA polymerase sigma factor (sigma-70 family)
MALSDRELWLRAAAGEAEAFGELYDRHANAIYNYCFRRTADWALAEDLTANVFLAAWRKRRRVAFDREDGVLPWLYGVANNVLRNEARRHRRLMRFLAGVAAQPTGRDPATELQDVEEMRRILETIRELPNRERDVLALCVFAELTYEQAALSLGVPIGTVRSRLARARTRLAELSPERGHERADGPSAPSRTPV